MQFNCMDAERLFINKVLSKQPGQVHLLTEYIVQVLVGKRASYEDFTILDRMSKTQAYKFKHQLISRKLQMIMLIFLSCLS